MIQRVILAEHKKIVADIPTFRSSRDTPRFMSASP